jgi:CBS domain-containing protein
VQAAEIDEQFPVVDIDSSALEAARMLAEDSLPGIVVVTADRQLYAVLPASQVVRFIVPSYVQDDPLLAGVLAESMADGAAEKLGGKTLRELLPQRQLTPPAVNADDTIIEVAAMMERLRSPLIAVMQQGRLHGVITASRLLAMALKCRLTEQAWTAVVTGLKTERPSSLSTWQFLEQPPDQRRSTAWHLGAG